MNVLLFLSLSTHRIFDHTSISLSTSCVVNSVTQIISKMIRNPFGINMPQPFVHVTPTKYYIFKVGLKMKRKVLEISTQLNEDDLKNSTILIL